MTGVGIDLLEIDRLQRALARRPHLAERLFTAAERAYAQARPRPGRHLAARFCAKEPIAKALAPQVWGPADVEVVSADGDVPRVRLSGRAAERADALGVSVGVSVTHGRDTAAAMAVAA